MRPAFVYLESSNSDTVKNGDLEKQEGLLHRGYKSPWVAKLGGIVTESPAFFRFGALVAFSFGLAGGDAQLGKPQLARRIHGLNYCLMGGFGIGGNY